MSFCSHHVNVIVALREITLSYVNKQLCRIAASVDVPVPKALEACEWLTSLIKDLPRLIQHIAIEGLAVYLQASREDLPQYLPITLLA